jgi:hypothetical protein
MRFFVACIFALVLGSAPLLASGQQLRGTAATNDNARIWEHQLSGKIRSVKGFQLEVETRDKRNVEINAETAIKNRRTNAIFAGSFITAAGAYDDKGIFRAQSIHRAKNSSKAWPTDR